MFVYDQWVNFDALVQDQIEGELRKIAPDWNIQIGPCQFELMRSRVRIHDLQIRLDGRTAPIAVLPETLISVDITALTERQQVVLEDIRMIGPRIYLERDSSGHWNWQDLPPLRKSRVSLPGWSVTDGMVTTHLQSSTGGTAVEYHGRDLTAEFVPSAKRQFDWSAKAEIEGMGLLEVTKGRWNIDGRTWEVNARLEGMTIDDGLIQNLASLSPSIGAKVAQLSVQLPVEPAPLAGRSPFTLADERSVPATAITPTVPPDSVPATLASHAHARDLGLETTADVNFRIKRWQPDAELDYNVSFAVRDGRIGLAAYPFPFDNLTGLIYIDNRHVQFRDLTGGKGATRVTLSGKFSRGTASPPGRLEVNVDNLACDQRLRNRLPPSLARGFDMIQPSGLLDLKATLSLDGQGKWSSEKLLVTTKGCSLTHERFPYPLNTVTGTIKQLPSAEPAADGEGQDFVLDVDLRGQAGHKPITLDGIIRNPGPEAETFYDIRAYGVPLDEAFRKAAAAQPALLQKLAELNLRGFADMFVQCVRPPGLGQKHKMRLAAQLTDGSAEYDKFPYRVEGLTGTVTFNEGKWLFSDVRGTHGDADVAGSGSYEKTDGVGRLDLNLAGNGVVIDDALMRAMTPTLQSVQQAVTDLSLAGTLNFAAKIEQIGGAPPVIALPKIELNDGAVHMKAFPYAIRAIKVRGRYGVRNGVPLLELTTVEGQRDTMSIRFMDSWAKFEPGDWTVRLNHLTVKNLRPDQTFRDALPEGLQSVLDCLDPRQTLGLTGMLEFRGTDDPRFPMTAAWDVETDFSGGTITLGLDYKDVVGRARARGVWDGFEVAIPTGSINLESATVLDYHLQDIHGPFRVKDGKVIVGSEKAFLPKGGDTKRPLIPPEERIVAHAIDGTITLDAEATLTDEPDYQVELNLLRGDLQEYARLYIPGQANLRGIMDGWISLKGRGSGPAGVSGRGQLQISPAALYELPIIAQIFNVIQFFPPQSTAFDYALLDFRIEDQQFRFGGIYLDGTAISLRGRGSIDFEKRVNLDFYSTPPRRQTPIRVAVSNVVGPLATGWIGVKVLGTTNSPVPTIKPVPNLDDALKNFLQRLPPLLAPVMSPRPAQISEPPSRQRR